MLRAVRIVNLLAVDLHDFSIAEKVIFGELDLVEVTHVNLETDALNYVPRYPPNFKDDRVQPECFIPLNCDEGHIPYEKDQGYVESHTDAIVCQKRLPSSPTEAKPCQSLVNFHDINYFHD